MKHVFFLCSLTTASTVLLVNCGKPMPTNTDTTQQKGSPMVRVKTNSGLEYEILKEGNGEMPVQGKSVTVHYTGWLEKQGNPGEQFDSSVDRGAPFTFIIGKGQVIKGWDEGVLTMKVGEKRRLFIPAQLGYGSRGTGGIIPPNATLIFDVELLKVS
jgi:FKBP-type peptidyl-prolyl cis-trans isomerase